MIQFLAWGFWNWDAIQIMDYQSRNLLLLGLHKGLATFPTEQELHPCWITIFQCEKCVHTVCVDGGICSFRARGSVRFAFTILTFRSWHFIWEGKESEDVQRNPVDLLTSYTIRQLLRYVSKQQINIQKLWGSVIRHYGASFAAEAIL